MSEDRRAPFSVLLSTYARERPEHLDQALRSIAEQTLPPAEMVVVLDGAVEPAQLEVVDRVGSSFPWLPLRQVALPENRGLAAALNAGLEACTQPWIARMDSDDIAVPERFEVQWRALQADPVIDVLGAWHVEFESDPELTERLKTTPASHDVIARTLVWRCPISHPTIVVRASLLKAVGGYRSVPYLEDYDLYMRLLGRGARFAAVQSPLVRVRATHDQYRRRGGLAHLRAEWRFRWDCLRRGDLSIGQFVATTSAYTVFRLLPARLRAESYRLVRRSPARSRR